MLAAAPPPTMTTMDVYDANNFHSDEADPLPTGFHIPIANQQEVLAIEEQCIQAVVHSVLEDSPYQNAMVSVAIVDDPAIHEINRKYLQHDYPTDVLSFVLNSEGHRLEAELIVSAETAIQNASQYNWAPANELLLYVIHGTLHLVGYLDKSPADQAVMVAAEATYLQKLGVVLPANQSRWQLPNHGEVTTQ